MQRNNETKDSYVACHTTHFEALLATCVLLRHSKLSLGGTKTLVLKFQGNLTYVEAVKAICLFGSKLSRELQSKNSASNCPSTEKTPVCDVHVAKENGSEPDDDYITEFEDPIVDAI